MISMPDRVAESSSSSVRLVITTAIASTLVACGVSEPERRADLVLTGGNVATMSEAASSAEAIAVRGDRIYQLLAKAG